MVIVESMLLIASLFVGSLFLKDDCGLDKRLIRMIQVGLFCLIFVPWLPNSYANCSTTQAGTCFTFGKASTKTTDKGMIFPLFPGQTVKLRSVADQSFELDNHCFTTDLQQLHLRARMTAKLFEQEVPKSWALTDEDPIQLIMVPKTAEKTKSEASKHPSVEVIPRFAGSQRTIEKELAEVGQSFGISVTSVSLESPVFEPGYQSAVDKKKIASAKVEAAKNDLETHRTTVQTQISEARGGADKKISEARGNSLAKKKKAESEAYETTTLALANFNAQKALIDAELMNLKRVGKAVQENPGVIDLEINKKWKGNTPSKQFNTATEKDPLNLQLQFDSDAEKASPSVPSKSSK